MLITAVMSLRNDSMSLSALYLALHNCDFGLLEQAVNNLVVRKTNKFYAVGLEKSAILITFISRCGYAGVTDDTP
jgi:hypothetical protein